jgi:hypothetical protein
MTSFLLPTSNAAHFHILRVFHQVKQWIGEADNMEAKDWGWSHNMQNPTQRGFTKGSSPMNAALPVEEAYRILTDEKQNGHLVLLDAKTAFDKVKGRGTLVRSSFY